ncbi:FAD binding domain-containing protein [Salipaludibacillus agaradhaerens]|uniref:FAD binding domain-containing protein n=1 Tax=Salipaludibacillus agaradhaerens TaxID=76935 RepID=A0A9Q4B3M3_SALAG|nr:FAD binding domain-containing protein [Salipaludibacillus agaradhaerens]MCR6097661.1 FAD binding domain-containing protein [Salipaludibacillus agaradhaerens]MCR6112855.1 FAD binding domain-containing protein [Salipaludibacillus agaradhaerens]
MVTEGKVWRPNNLNDAWALSQQLMEPTQIVSGGTWLRTQWEGGALPIAPHLISLDSVPEVTTCIHIEKDELVIGAMTALADIIGNTLIEEWAPLLAKTCQNIASPSVRNQATLGGNVISRVGDTIPVLLVLEATLTWCRGDEMVNVSVQEWMETSVDAWGILVCVRVPLKREENFSFFMKMGRRETFIPSLVTVAGRGNYSEETREITTISLAAGGGNTSAMRLIETEKFLTEKRCSSSVLIDVLTVIQDDFKPSGDPFASAYYKRQVAANLIVSELYRLGGVYNEIK